MHCPLDRDLCVDCMPALPFSSQHSMSHYQQVGQISTHGRIACSQSLLGGVRSALGILMHISCL